MTDKNSSLHVLFRFFGYLKNNLRLVVAIYFSMFVGTAILMVLPQLIRWIVDRGIAQRDFKFVQIAVLSLIVLVIIRSFFVYLQGRWTEIISQEVSARIRTEIFTRLTLMSVSIINRLESGNLLQRSVQDVERIRFLTGRAILRIVEAVVLFLVTLIFLLRIDPVLGVLSLVTMPLLAVQGYQYGARQRPLALKIQKQLGNLTTILEQNLRGIRLVKGFTQELNEIEKFEKQNKLWFNLAARNARLTSLNSPLMDFIANLGLVVVIGVGGIFVINKSLSLGELVGFTAYLSQLFGPVRRVGMVIPMLAMAAASGERITVLLDTPDGVEDKLDNDPIPLIKGNIKFNDVSFRYSDTNASQQNEDTEGGQLWALNQVDLSVKAGSTVALLGATGAGKSTLVSMLFRLYDPTKGQVMIDGYDLSKISLSSIRSQVGIVMQDSFLFASTIYDNIAFGKSEATKEQVIAAAEAACIHEFISGLDNGYSTEVGEQGVTLSGGQRQRIAIARAILVDPRILILDDATSSVDAQTEDLIHQALKELLLNRTAFVVAQRLSTLRLADQVVVMDQGRITNRGTHEELIDSSLFYRTICERQMQE